MLEYLFLLLVGILLRAFRVLDLTATVLTLLIAGMIWQLRGFSWFFILLSFFIIAYAATLLRNKIAEQKHEKRGIDNLISNALVAFMASLFGSDFVFVFLGSISAALADTLGSEIGVLSRQDPRLITDLKRSVSPGTNGGITLLGTSAGALGGLVIAAMAVFFAPSLLAGSFETISLWVFFLSVVLGGVAGSFFDSFLGAVLENKNILSKGSVNFFGTLFGGLVTASIVFLSSLL